MGLFSKNDHHDLARLEPPKTRKEGVSDQPTPNF